MAGTRDILSILSIDLDSPLPGRTRHPFDPARRPCYTTPGHP